MLKIDHHAIGALAEDQAPLVSSDLCPDTGKEELNPSGNLLLVFKDLWLNIPKTFCQCSKQWKPQEILLAWHGLSWRLDGKNIPNYHIMREWLAAAKSL